MEYKNITLNVKDGIATVVLNRPDKLNALNTETLKELYSCFIDMNNKQDIKAVILTGSGEKAFAAGADIKEISQLDVLAGKQFAEFGQQVFNYIQQFSKPVIAAINGFALGGGCELALACHIRIASENSKFGQPEVNLGIIPGYGGTQRLAQLIGKGRAVELILTGDIIDSNEAYRIGLVNKIFPLNELLSRSAELANKIISKGGRAVSFALQALNFTDDEKIQSGLNMEAVLFALCCGTEDFKEGTNAFLEKRKPVFNNK
jgi:enoyl-CoA hydratase